MNSRDFYAAGPRRTHQNSQNGTWKSAEIPQDYIRTYKCLYLYLACIMYTRCDVYLPRRRWYRDDGEHGKGVLAHNTTAAAVQRNMYNMKTDAKKEPQTSSRSCDNSRVYRYTRGRGVPLLRTGRGAAIVMYTAVHGVHVRVTTTPVMHTLFSSSVTRDRAEQPFHGQTHYHRGHRPSQTVGRVEVHARETSISRSHAAHSDDVPSRPSHARRPRRARTHAPSALPPRLSRVPSHVSSSLSSRPPRKPLVPAAVAQTDHRFSSRSQPSVPDLSQICRSDPAVTMTTTVAAAAVE